MYRSEGWLHLCLTEQRMLAQGSIPFGKVVNGRVDTAVAQHRGGWTLVRLFPAVMLFRVAEGAVRHLVLPLLIGQGVIHAQRREDSVVQELAEGLPRDFLHDHSQRGIARVAVLPLRPGRELGA